jgi:predicted Zn-dependent protease
VVTPPKNKYTPKQDVELGRKAAAEVRQTYPIISDDRIASYLATLGRLLVAAAPPELNELVYEYSFTPREPEGDQCLRAPGRTQFLQRGMFDVAAEEGEVAGVMAPSPARIRSDSPGSALSIGDFRARRMFPE